MIVYLICPIPEVVNCPFKSFENETLNTSCDDALLRKRIFSSFQSQIVNMKSGLEPNEANRSPSLLNGTISSSLLLLSPSHLKSR